MPNDVHLISDARRLRRARARAGQGAPALRGLCQRACAPDGTSVSGPVRFGLHGRGPSHGGGHSTRCGRRGWSSAPGRGPIAASARIWPTAMTGSCGCSRSSTGRRVSPTSSTRTRTARRHILPNGRRGRRRRRPPDQPADPGVPRTTASTGGVDDRFEEAAVDRLLGCWLRRSPKNFLDFFSCYICSCYAPVIDPFGLAFLLLFRPIASLCITGVASTRPSFRRS